MIRPRPFDIETEAKHLFTVALANTRDPIAYLTSRVAQGNKHIRFYWANRNHGSNREILRRFVRDVRAAKLAYELALAHALRTEY